MNKNCEECGTDFIVTTTKGNEQKYCSHKCRSRAGNKRRERQLIEKYKKENEKQTENQDSSRIVNGIINRSFDNNDGSGSIETISRYGHNLPTKRENMDGSYTMSLIEKNFETKSELIESKLRIEYLTKENEELKRQIGNLEVELAQFEQEDEDPESNNWIGGVMEQFKTDPVTTISFATELINGLLKPKNNEKP